MVLNRLDWKNQSRNVFDWLTVGAGLALLLIHFYQGWVDGGAHHHGLWIAFGVWLVVYFTEYWQPILYLVIAVPVAIITGFMVLQGAWEQPIDQVTIVLTAAFLLSVVSLFFHEGAE